MMRIKVIERFMDKETSEVYNEGKILNFDDQDRVNDLCDRGLVEVIEKTDDTESNLITLFSLKFDKKVVIEALKAIGVKAAWNIKDETLIANVDALDKEKAEALQTALNIP